jgi:hypothetical protein
MAESVHAGGDWDVCLISPLLPGGLQDAARTSQYATSELLVGVTLGVYCILTAIRSTAVCMYGRAVRVWWGRR